MAHSRRYFSPEFKRQAVLECLSGTTSQAAIARRYELHGHVLRNWIRAYRTGQLDTGSVPPPVKALEARIRELERLVGKLTWENELLKKLEVYTRERPKGSGLIAYGAPGKPTWRRDAE